MSIDIYAEISKQLDESHGIDGVDALSRLEDALREREKTDYLGTLYRTDYEVAGKGGFPVDMLRYTCSWPADETSTGEIERSLDSDVGGLPLRTIKLTKYHRDPEPQLAADRWSSKFRWMVQPPSVRTVPL